MSQRHELIAEQAVSFAKAVQSINAFFDAIPEAALPPGLRIDWSEAQGYIAIHADTRYEEALHFLLPYGSLATPEPEFFLSSRDALSATIVYELVVNGIGVKVFGYVKDYTALTTRTYVRSYVHSLEAA